MRALSAATLVAVTAMMPPGAIAQQPDEERGCFAREGVAPEQKLASCTAVIKSGGQTPQRLVAAFTNRGNVYLSNRNYDSAVDDYNEAIRLNPKFASGFNVRGVAYLRKGRIDHAIEDFDEAIRLNPTFVLAFVNRAIAYQEKAQWDFDAYLAEGRYEDRAIQDLDEAIRLAPSVAASFSGRAYALRFVGQYERAITDYRKALTLPLDDVARRQIEKLLKQLGAATERAGTPQPLQTGDGPR